MKPSIFSLFILLLGLTACSKTEKSAEERHAEAKEEGVEFSEKYGLLVPPKTGEFIGLKTMDVEEKTLTSTLHFRAQVYEVSSEKRALLSGSVPKEVASELKEGEDVILDFEGNRVKGKISHKKQTTSGSGLLEVLLETLSSPNDLKLGAFATVYVPNGKEETVVSIPKEALLKTVEGSFVYTLSGEHFVRTAVKVRGVDEKDVEVTDGLLAGDKIAVTPVMSLWLAELQSIRGGKACADGH